MSSQNHMVVLEVFNVTDEQIQKSLGKKLHDFCKENKESSIRVSVMNEIGKSKIKKIINKEGSQR